MQFEHYNLWIYVKSVKECSSTMLPNNSNLILGIDK